MRRIYLTININVNDKCFENLTDFEKINIGEIVKGKQMILKPFELEKIRAKLVVEVILENESNILIGSAIGNTQDLLTIFEILKEQEMSVSRIYFDNGTRSNAVIEKYKKDYALHSRWLDYTPEYVEQSYNEFNKEIEEIKNNAIENRIEIIAI